MPFLLVSTAALILIVILLPISINPNWLFNLVIFISCLNHWLTFSLINVQLLYCILKHQLNIITCPRTCLKEFIYLKFNAKIYCFFSSYFTLIFQISSISNKKYEHILNCILTNFCYPLRSTNKGFFFGNIISQEYTISIPIKNSRNRSECFLSSSIPYLQFNNLLILVSSLSTPIFDCSSIRTKFNTYSHTMFFLEVVVHYAREETSFSDT